MPGYYFERYAGQASAAVNDGSMLAVSRGDLIKGIEDIGGHERAAIAAAVPAEAAIMARALGAAGVAPNSRVEFIGDIPVRGERGLKPGWYLGTLENVPYIDADGAVHHADEAKSMVATDGSLYAYREEPWDTGGRLAISGVALNRYDPACASSMNDRAMLHGIAVTVAHYDLEMPPTA